MKLKDVPQDNDASYEGAKKLCYAIDDQGQFVSATTNGWHVEETVKSLAWQMIEKDLEQTRQQILEGKASPLKYFMKLRQMNTRLLSENMQISILRTYWHLRPNIFKKLNDTWLARYANCLEIPVDILRSYNGHTKSPI